MQKILDFFKEISEDEAAKQKLQSVSQKLGAVNSEEDAKKIITSELVPLAKSKGYNITAGEFIEFLKNANTELTDDALAMASGGRSTLGEKIGNALMFIGAGTSLFSGMTFGLGGSSGNTAKQNNRPAYVQTVDNNRDMLKSTMQSNSDAGTGKAATETQAQNKAQTKNNARTLQQRTSGKARSKSVSARNVPFSQKVGRNFGERVNAKALDEATKNKEAVANFKEIIDNKQSREKKVDKKDKEIKKDLEKDTTEGKVEEVKEVKEDKMTELTASDGNHVENLKVIKKGDNDNDNEPSGITNKEGEQMNDKSVKKSIENSEENDKIIDKKDKKEELKGDSKTTINNDEIDKTTNESHFSKAVSDYSDKLKKLSNTDVSLIEGTTTVVDYGKVAELAETLKKLEEALIKDKEALKQKEDSSNIVINNEQVSKNEGILEGYYKKLIALWEKASGYGKNYDGENLNKNVENIKTSLTNSEYVQNLVKGITGEKYLEINNEKLVEQLNVSNKDGENESYLAAVGYVAYGKEILNNFSNAVQKGNDALKNAVQNFVDTENEKLESADTSIKMAIDKNDNLEDDALNDLF